MELQPPPAFSRKLTAHQSTGTMRSAGTSSNLRQNSTGPVPTAAAFLEAGYPGIQYVVTDPDSQYQKYVIIVLQLPSGIDPLNPPNITGVLAQGGQRFDVTIPVCAALQTEGLLVNRKAAWMSRGGSLAKGSSMYYRSRQTRLGGLGPAIAKANSFYCGIPWSTVWKLPLAEPCDEVIGNFSITNFPLEGTISSSRKYYPVLCEFKLRTVEQTVTQHTRINTGDWFSDDSESDQSSYSSDEDSSKSGIKVLESPHKKSSGL